jgi:hypothetical protein
MTAIDDFAVLLETTPPMQSLLRSLKEEPAQLLGDICREYLRSQQPVPDHHLQMVGYLGETAALILMAAGLVKRDQGGSYSIWVYQPTDDGVNQYEKLRTGGFYKNK